MRKAWPYWEVHLIKGAQGRHKACPYLSVWGEYCWLDTLPGKFETRSLARAGRCGGGAPAQGRAEGPELQWSVVSGQRHWRLIEDWCEEK